SVGFQEFAHESENGVERGEVPTEAALRHGRQVTSRTRPKQPPNAAPSRHPGADGGPGAQTKRATAEAVARSCNRAPSLGSEDDRAVQRLTADRQPGEVDAVRHPLAGPVPQVPGRRMLARRDARVEHIADLAAAD